MWLTLFFLNSTGEGYRSEFVNVRTTAQKQVDPRVRVKTLLVSHRSVISPPAHFNMDDSLRRSPLHDVHISAGARMVPFAGWEMPVQFEGIIPEHKTVRERLGIFDISHMGQLIVTDRSAGDACEWLNRMLTNDVTVLQPGDGQYTLLLNDNGGVIDDLIVYRQDQQSYFLVVNASKTAEDFAWLSSHLPDDGPALTNHSDDYAAMAVQGPEAVAAFESVAGGIMSLPERFCMAKATTPDGSVIVCRTGYTGEDGFELFCDVSAGATWWQRFTEAGAVPCGLGARDTLRLEKCYPLNGNDLSPDRTPLEAGLGFAVKLGKPEFIGHETLRQQKTDGLPTRLVALKQTEKSPPPRPGYPVFAGDVQVGELSSGGMSPGLGCGISMAYIIDGHNKAGATLEVEIRGKRFSAEVVKKPFV